MNRRDFLKTATLATAAISMPSALRAQGDQPSPRKLAVACCGVGGRGRAAVEGLESENLVAFCDVDDAWAAETFAKYPNVPRFKDYRVMLEKMGSQIDAVTVSTPDHMHFPIAMAAIALGKHVFVEKPLTHTVAEARALAKAAKEKGVATQMGNQGHAGEGTRVLKEWVDGGVLGEVREIHSWTDRPIWPQGVKPYDHSKMMPVVPPTLDWNLWLGVAPAREYDPGYMPFNWRGFWDFGSGALGDMGCHIMDGAFNALDLGYPDWVEPVSGTQTEISFPTASMVRFHFPARGNKPEVLWTWYDGGLVPPRPAILEDSRHLADNGTLLVGSKETVLCDTYYESVRIIPEVNMKAAAPNLPRKTLPRVGMSHFKEWVRACKGGVPAGSNFEYAARLTETVILGNVALRMKRRIEWDAAAMRVTNVPGANAFITENFRPGFGV